MTERSNIEAAPAEKEKAGGINARLEAMLTPQNTAIVFWIGFICFTLYGIYMSPGESRWLFHLVKVLFLGTMGLWMVADGRSRGIRQDWLNLYFVGAIFLFIVAVPIYLVHSRGWAGAARSSLRFAGYLLLSFLFLYGMTGILELFGIHVAGEPVFQF